MASWQDSLSEQALDDLDGLAKSALPFAKQQLDRHGEFFPYGLALNAAGETRMVAADPDLGDRPPSLEVLGTIVDGMRMERDQLRAVALVADVRISDGDAVRVELEHREGQATVVLLPYKKKRFGRGIDFGDMRGADQRPSYRSGTGKRWSSHPGPCRATLLR